MNLVNIIIKGFKQNIRNWKANLMMVLFPIILIIILGAAFKGIFSNGIKLNNVKVLYTVQPGKYLAQDFKTFTAELEKSVGIKFEETNDIDKGIASIKDVRYTCYILVANNPEEIKIYKNDRFSLEANIVQSMVDTFATRYSAISAIYKENPSIVGKILADNTMDFVTTESLDKKRQPGSFDYYGVAMLTLIMMYASLTGMWSIKGEQLQKTGNRMLCSPVSKYTVLTGKIFGGILVTIVQFCVIILFSKYFLKVNWGEDIWTIMLIVLSEAVMATSIGAGIAYLIRNDGAASGILNSFIPIIVFLGGGYTPISNFNGFLLKLTDISPVKWVNQSIFGVIYNNDYSKVLSAITINLAIAAVFIIISAVFSKKEAA